MSISIANDLIPGTGARAPVAKVALILAAFLGAFLMFQLEPLTGKIITPRFGGSAAVWSVCLLFFQVMVLGGYTLTLGLSRLSPRLQTMVYLVLSVASLIWAAIPAAASWTASGDPAEAGWQVLMLLLQHVAAPSLILASVSGMTQLWYRRAGLGNPYPLYSVSNIGSLAALISFPTLFEPWLSVTRTLFAWHWLYVGLVGLVIVSAALMGTGITVTDDSDGSASAGASTGAPALSSWWQWIFLSMCGSLILMTFTAYITADIAAVPLLWVLPLTIYLLSFVIVFANQRFYSPGFFAFAWLAILCLEQDLTDHTAWERVGLNLVLVFLMCMFCHGQLAASKPHPKHLAGFYFCLSLGGMIGGILVAFVAPILFSCDLERWVTIAVIGALSVAVMIKRKLYFFKQAGLSYVTLAAVFGILGYDCRCYLYPEGLIHRERNFYGSVEVRKGEVTLGLFHGKILHGRQFLDPEKADIPIVYYGQPIGILDSFLRTKRHSLQYGAVGLGVGTVAAYGQTGDEFNFFELDPKIKRIAQTNFSYLAHCRAKVEISLGDGRALLRDLHGKKFDLLLIDAFSGDAVPMHLLTLEAMQIYLDQLKPDGLLVFHVTNRYADLVAPVAKAGDELGLAEALVTMPEHGWKYVILSKNGDTIEGLRDYYDAHGDDYDEISVEDVPDRKGVGYWTDDFANIFQVLE